MPRPPRIHASGLIYHVFSRGNNKEPIFYEETDYKRFLNNLERFRLQFGYDLYAYCLMPNHFHLLLKVASSPISKIMQVIMTAYTMYINKKHDRVGHIFGGRFKSIVVEKETYLLQVQRYMHINPIKAGLVALPEQYAWSSYRYYFANENNTITLETSEILNIISQNSQKQRHLFHEFTLDGIRGSFDPQKEQMRGILGSQKFMIKLTKVLSGARP